MVSFLPSWRGSFRKRQQHWFPLAVESLEDRTLPSLTPLFNANLTGDYLAVGVGLADENLHYVQLGAAKK